MLEIGRDARVVAVDARDRGRADQPGDLGRDRARRVALLVLPALLLGHRAVLDDEVGGLADVAPVARAGAPELPGEHDRQADLVHLQRLPLRRAVDLRVLRERAVVELLLVEEEVERARRPRPCRPPPAAPWRSGRGRAPRRGGTGAERGLSGSMRSSPQPHGIDGDATNAPGLSLSSCALRTSSDGLVGGQRPGRAAAGIGLSWLRYCDPAGLVVGGDAPRSRRRARPWRPSSAAVPTRGEADRERQVAVLAAPGQARVGLLDDVARAAARRRCARAGRRCGPCSPSSCA